MSSNVNYDEDLNEAQLEVVKGGEGPCLVLAGAGSGKTRTITYRVAYLIEAGVPAENILLLTFTNKAANEMLSRVESLLGSYPVDLWGGTFHSVANRILRKYAPKLGYESNFTILDQEDSKSLIKVCIKDLKIDTKARRFPSPAVIQNLISYARNASINLKQAIERKHPNFLELADTIGQIAQMYRERKKAANAMDFDDMLLLLLELLKEHPDVRDRLAQQFRYILVDEFQDTNIIQAEIVKELARVHGNILVVGDDAQSIYSFRAAEIKNILNFPKTFPGTQTFRLTTNYRSTPQVLDVANAVIRQNAEQFKKELEAVVEAGEKPSLVPTSNAKQEADYIAEQILTLRDEGVPMNDMAVLFRATFHSQALEMELMKRDIPYEYRGGLKFFERAHIKDVVAHLKTYSNPKDETAWMRVLGHQPGIGIVAAGKIIGALRDSTSYDSAIKTDMEAVLPARAKTGWHGHCRIAQKLLNVNDTPGDLIRAIAASDYFLYLESEYPDYRDRLEDIEQMAIFAEGYTDLTKFLQEITLKEDYGAVREKATYDDERLILSTVHQAKGLEWNSVFVMNLTQGGFPNQRALNEDGGLEEERRLFYVASTRARKNLFMTYPLTSGFDTLVLNQPSMFLGEIPEGMYEEVKVREEFRRSHVAGRTSFERSDDWDEPTIVFDNDGERVNKPMPTSFLRDVDEL
ncbi:ATP-dependent helicase [Patescibacteria group bacterium]|nr:ATP-dependent helicase [Patescibacteria group bacterium]MBU1906677.1 ATP-dependent helicase [Patescibacteria group bacterium]